MADETKHLVKMQLPSFRCLSCGARVKYVEITVRDGAVQPEARPLAQHSVKCRNYADPTDWLSRLPSSAAEPEIGHIG
jgi:hypothetical protein